MARVKSSRVPEGGWTNETFRTRNGRELIRDLAKAHRAVIATGSRKLVPFLKKYFDTIYEETEKKVAQHYRDTTGESLKTFLIPDGKDLYTFNTGGHEAMWMSALDDVMRENQLGFIQQNSTIIQSVAASSYDTTRKLLSVPQDSGEARRARAAQGAMNQRVQRVTSRIANMTQTTRNQFQRTLVRAIQDGETVAGTAKIMRERFPQMSRNRISTIARTELGQAADEGRKQALKDNGAVTHVSVIGCEAREANSPTYRGESTCNVEDVPIEDVDELEWHPNHTGTIVPSKFVGDEEAEGEVVGSPVEDLTPEDASDMVRGDGEYDMGFDDPEQARAFKGAFGVNSIDELAADGFDETFRGIRSSGVEGEDAILDRICRARGYDGLPRVVDQQELQNIGGDMLYRGIAAPTEVEAKAMMDQFRTGKMFAGRGVDGNGTYTAYGKGGYDRALYHAQNNNQNLLGMKLREGSRVIDSKELGRVREDWLERVTATSYEKQRAFEDAVFGRVKRGEITKDEARELRRSITDRANNLRSNLNKVVQDDGRFAAITGYDAIRVESKEDMVVVNRSACIVSNVAPTN